MASTALRARRRRERGSAIIEAAFVAPVFFFIIFGILEYGLLFRDSLTTTNASREAARAASVNGKALESDYLILRTLEHGISAMGIEAIEYVVVFNATTVGYELPDSHLCHTQPVTNVCNRYVTSDFALELDADDGTALTNFRCVAGSAKDRHWCPNTRRSGLGDDSDLVGVFIKSRHDYITGFFGDSRTLEATTVIRVEPDEDS